MWTRPNPRRRRSPLTRRHISDRGWLVVIGTLMTMSIIVLLIAIVKNIE
jgi:hypothetical protein